MQSAACSGFRKVPKTLFLPDCHHDRYVNWFPHSTPYIKYPPGLHLCCVACRRGRWRTPIFSISSTDIMLLNSLGVRLVLVHVSPPADRGSARAPADSSSLSTMTCALTRRSDTLGLCNGCRWQFALAIEDNSVNCPYRPSGRALKTARGQRKFRHGKPIGVATAWIFIHTGEVRRIGIARRSRRQPGPKQSIRAAVFPWLLAPPGSIQTWLAKDVATSAPLALEADKLILFGPARRHFSTPKANCCAR